MFLQLLQNPIFTWLEQPVLVERPLSRASVIPPKRAAACSWGTELGSSFDSVEFQK